jgi:hypothetical protein
MKKTIFILLLTAILSLTSYAQEYKTSLGARVGFPYGLTIRHFFDKKNAIEGILASQWQGFVAIALLENEHWTGFYPGLNWYWGAGVHAGFWDSNPYVNTTRSVIGIDGVFGLEYTFDEIPLNLSLDLMPSFNLIGSTGWNGINAAISVRYVF